MKKNYVSKSMAALAIVSMMFTGCARNMASNVYTSSAPVGKVLEGTVISSRPVTIKDSDKLQDNTLGMLGGGLVGGLAGSGVGKGTGNSLAIAGGAIAAAVAGSMLQSKLSSSQGMEYVVRLDAKYVNNTPQATVEKRKITIGESSIDEDIKDSIAVANTKTDLLSVVQGNDIVFAPGQRVLVIYSNDRPRLAPLQ